MFFRISLNNRKALQDASNYIHDGTAKPKKSALKGGRERHKNENNIGSKNQPAVESGSDESASSESEPENRPPPTPSVVIPSPLRPSALTRPPTTASNEKVSTQRNPLIGVAPLRPSSLSKDSEKRDEHKDESITVRLNNRLKQREEDNKKESARDAVKFNIPRPGGKSEDKDFKIPRPGNREEIKKDEPKASFNIPRPNSLRNGDKKDDKDTKIDDLKSRIGPPSRISRKEEREEESKRHSSKADEIRAKFNIPRPGDSAASSALRSFRERRNETEEDNKTKTEKAEEEKKVGGTKIEEVCWNFCFFIFKFSITFYFIFAIILHLLLH